MKLTALLLTVSLGLAAKTGARADTIVFATNPTGGAGNAGGYGTAGTPFHVGAGGATIHALGYFDPMAYWGLNQSGLSTAHNVGIYDASETLLCSVLVPSGPGVTLHDGTRWVALSGDVPLPGDADYMLAFTIAPFANDFLVGAAGQVTIGSGFSLRGSGWTVSMVPGPELHYPGLSTTGTSYIFGGNMETPEPGCLALGTLGLALLLVSRRRRR